jgi:hypothetical protein
MKKWVGIVNKVIVYGFFVAGVILLFNGTGRITTTLTAFISFIAAVLFSWLFKIKGLNENYLIFVNLGLLLNVFGELIAYYSGILFYDKILHFLIGLLITLIVYDYYKKNSNLKGDAVFFTTMGLLGLWEIYEYVLDTYFGFTLQGIIRSNSFVQTGLADTIMDMIWGAIGSLGYLFFKKEKVDATIKKNVSKIKNIKPLVSKKAQINNFRLAIQDVLGFRI